MDGVYENRGDCVTREKEIEYLDKIANLQKKLEPKAPGSVRCTNHAYNRPDGSCYTCGDKPASSLEFDVILCEDEIRQWQKKLFTGVNPKSLLSDIAQLKEAQEFGFFEGARWQHARDAEEIARLNHVVESLEAYLKYERNEKDKLTEENQRLQSEQNESTQRFVNLRSDWLEGQERIEKLEKENAELRANL